LSGETATAEDTLGGELGDLADELIGVPSVQR
jgi:hypothetical protein